MKRPDQASSEDIQLRATLLQETFEAWNGSDDLPKMIPPPFETWVVASSAYYILLNGYKAARMKPDTSAQAPKAAACTLMAIALTDPMFHGGAIEGDEAPSDSARFAVSAAISISLLKVVGPTKLYKNQRDALDVLTGENAYFYATQARLARQMSTYTIRRGKLKEFVNPFYKSFVWAWENSKSWETTGLKPYDPHPTQNQTDTLKFLVSIYEGILGRIPDLACSEEESLE